MKRFLYVIYGLLLSCAIKPSISNAQTPPPYQNNESLVSNIAFYTSNYGIFGLDIANAKSGFVAPRGSNNLYLFGGGLWFGAKKQVSTDGGTTFEEKKLSFISYNPNSGRSWATPGEFSGTSAIPILYHSELYDRSTGVSPQADPLTPNWPLWQQAGNPVNPLNPGTFIPVNNDRVAGGSPYQTPAFMPGVDEQFFARYHDANLQNYEIGTTQATQLGYPIGLQIQQNVYAWRPGDVRENVVILQYEIENMSDQTLRDCYVGEALDVDIGSAPNDRMSFYSENPLLHAGLIWSEMSMGDQNYGTLAVIMLEAPVVDANGFVDDNRRSLFRSSTDVHTFRNWVIDIDPNTPQERYDFLSAGVLDGDNGPGDKRALIATKPFHMKPGDKAHFSVALVVLEDVHPGATDKEKGHSPQAGVIPELEAIAKTLHQDYYEGIIQSSFAESPADLGSWGENLFASASPNPSTGAVAVKVGVKEQSDVTIRVANSLGQVVYVQQLSELKAGDSYHNIDLSDLEDGTYILSVEAGAERTTTKLNIVR